LKERWVVPSIPVNLAILALVGQLATPAESRTVLAAAQATDSAWSPRRLFNAGLVAEETGNLTEACQFMMAARLTMRRGFTDDLYAKGALLRLLKIVAGRDEDAATAAAFQVARAARSSALDPMVKMLVRRLDRTDDLASVTGTILSVRLDKRTRHLMIELEPDHGTARIIDVGPRLGSFTAGHRVRALLRRVDGRARAGWRLVALSAERAEGWELMRVRGLEGAPVPSHGGPLGRQGHAGPNVSDAPPLAAPPPATDRP